MNDRSAAGKIVVCCCLVPAVAAVSVFAAPLAGVPVAAGAAVGLSALGSMLSSLGGNVLAAWLDRLGSEGAARKVLDFLKSSRHPPMNHDMARVVEVAAAKAIACCVERFTASQSHDRGTALFVHGLRERAKALAAAGLDAKSISAADIRMAIAHALDEAAGTAVPAESALDAPLAESLCTLLIPAPDLRYRGLWVTLANDFHDLVAGKHADLPGGLRAVLAAFVVEALKTDTRFCRVVLLSTLAAVSETGTGTLAAVGRLESQIESLQDAWRQERSAQPESAGRVVSAEDLDRFRSALGAALDAFERSVREEAEHDRAPPLTWRTPDATAGFSLLYWNRNAHFLGRADALAALDAFLDAPGQVLWAVVTGPAGVGKSRLIVEALAARRQAGLVHAGFLNMRGGWLTGRRFETWRAPERTVIVIDYAGQSAVEIRDLIVDLAGRQNRASLGASVRILLIDTLGYDSEFGLRRRIVDGTERGAAADRHEWREQRYALDLGRLVPEDVLRIATQFAGRALDQAEAQRVRVAVAADSELSRPLFAAMIGLSLQEGRPVPLSVAAVTSGFLERQDKHWEESGITPLGRRVAAVATIAGSCPIDVADDPELEAQGTAIDALQRASSFMTGVAAPDRFAKLEPDFVGGLYVLRHVGWESPRTRRTDVRRKKESDRLMRLAWRHGQPGEFLINLARNFAGDAGHSRSVSELAALAPETRPEREAWATVLPYVVLALAEAHADDSADSVLSALASLASEKAVRAGYGKALFAGGLTIELTDHPRAAGRLQSLRLLAADHPGDSAVREWLAKGLFNAFVDAGLGERADALLGEFRRLAADHPDDVAVREWLAKGLFNAFNNAGPGERADAVLGELRRLAADHPDDVAVRELLARGLFNAFNTAGPGERADALLGELRRLAADHPDDAAVREWLAKGLFNAFNHAGPGERADALLGELRRLAADHPGDAAVRERLAKGLVNALYHAGPGERADALLGELRRLAADHPDDVAVREQLAKGLFNAFNHAGPGERADALLGELRRLAADHPDDAAVRVLLARGLVNAFVDAGPGERADALLGELRRLAADHPDDAAVREILARVGAAFP